MSRDFDLRCHDFDRLRVRAQRNDDSCPGPARDVIVLDGDEPRNLGFLRAWIEVDVELRQASNPVELYARQTSSGYVPTMGDQGIGVAFRPGTIFQLFEHSGE